LESLYDNSQEDLEDDPTNEPNFDPKFDEHPGERRTAGTDGIQCISDAFPRDTVTFLQLSYRIRWSECSSWASTLGERHRQITDKISIVI
jgi:hypothetical protein